MSTRIQNWPSPLSFDHSTVSSGNGAIGRRVTVQTPTATVANDDTVEVDAPVEAARHDHVALTIDRDSSGDLHAAVALPRGDARGVGTQQDRPLHEPPPGARREVRREAALRSVRPRVVAPL
jgi:hypothetical protein